MTSVEKDKEDEKTRAANIYKDLKEKCHTDKKHLDKNTIKPSVKKIGWDNNTKTINSKNNSEKQKKSDPKSNKGGEYPTGGKVITGMGPMTDKMIQSIVTKLTSTDFKERVTDKLLQPVLETMNRKLQPYFYTGIGLYIIVIILLIIILYLLSKKKNI